MDIFLQQAGQHQGMFPGVAPRPTQMFDLNGLPGMNGPMGMMLQMFLQPLMSQMMGQAGMIPGQFMPMQNMMDFQREREFFSSHQKAMKLAAESDKETYIRMMRGVSNLSGTKFGPEQYRAASTIAGDIASMGPILSSMMPEMFDEMHGVRGSNQVMSHFMHMAGRYGYDPVTGRPGMSADSVGAMSNRMFGKLFGEGADISKMHGLGAGRAGQMYDELQRRGYLGGGVERMSAEERQGLGDDKVRELQSDKVSSRIKSLSGVVAAVRDIFGDMGKPNAPMSELINGLQALTQGGLATMSPGQLEMTVRKVHNIARNSGMGIDAMMQMTAMGAGVADQMGLDRQFAISSSLGAASFGHAFGGLGRGDVAAFRRRDKEGLTVIDQQLRLRAANSPLANRFNAILRMADELVNPKDESEGAKEFRAYAEAIKSGQTEVGGRSVLRGLDELTKMANKAGITTDTFNTILSRTSANQEYGVKYGTEGTVRKLQGDMDINPIIRDVAAGALRSSMPGVDERSRFRAGDAVTKLLREMDPEVRADAGRRNQAIADTIWSTLTPAEQAASGGKQTMLSAASKIWTSLEDRVATSSRLKGYGGAHTMLDAHNRRLLEEAENFKAEQEGTAKLQSAMSGLGRSGPLRRFMSLLESAGPDEKPGDLFLKAFGGVPKGVAGKAMKGVIEEISKEQDKYNKLPPSEKGKRDKILDTIRTLIGGTGTGTDEIRNLGLAKYASNRGLVLDAPVTTSQAAHTLQDESDMRAALLKAERADKEGNKEVAKSARADAAYHAGMFMKRSDTIAGAMLMSDSAAGLLGKSGLEQVEGIQKRNRQLRELAESKGMTIDELIAGGNKTANDLMIENRSAVEFLRKRIAGGIKAEGDDAMSLDPKTPEGRKNRELLSEKQRLYKLTDKQVAEKLISTLGAGDEIKDVGSVAGIIGTGDRRFKVQEAIAAYKRVQDAKKAGKDVDDETLNQAKPLTDLTAGGRQATLRALQKALESIPAGKTDKKTSSAEPKTIKVVLTGSCKIEGGKIVFDNTRGTGTTPPEVTDA